MSKKPKATAAEMEARTTAVLTLLVGGADRPDILKKMEQDYQIGRASTDSLIKRATEILEAESKVQRAAEIGKAIRRLELIFKKAMSVQDYRVALSAQSQLSELLALNTPPTLKIVAELMTPNEAKLLADLLALLKKMNFTPGDMFAAMIAETAAKQEPTE